MTFPTLLSARLCLRSVTRSDLPTVHELLAHPETDRYNALGTPQSEDESALILKSWICDNERTEILIYNFAIEDAKSKVVVGLFGLMLGKQKYRSAQVWYKIHPRYWGKGYATEALNSILDFGFQTLKLHRIEAGCAVENAASVRVMEKVGMILEGRTRQLLPLDHGWSDTFEYAILESDPRKTGGG